MQVPENKVDTNFDNNHKTDCALVDKMQQMRTWGNHKVGQQMELQANAANPNPTLELCSTKRGRVLEQGDVPDCKQPRRTCGNSCLKRRV